MGGGGQGGWEQRSEACVKIQKKNKLGGGGGGGLGGQSGCEWRSGEAFVGGSGWGVRVDGKGELKLL